MTMTTSAIHRKAARCRDHRGVRQKAGIQKREIADQEIVERTLSISMVNEGALILAEGKAAARERHRCGVDLCAMCRPVYRGGPMFWAGLEGTDEDCRGALEKHGFTVALLLAEKAAAKAGF